MLVSTLFQPFPMLPGREAQVWHHQPMYRRPRHFHAEPELNLVTRGNGILSVGEQSFVVRTGDIVLLQPGQDHALLEESPDFELFVLALSPELAQRAGVALHRRLENRQVDARDLCNLRDALLSVGTLSCRLAVEQHLVELFLRLSSPFAKAHVLCRRTLERLEQDAELSELGLATELQTDASGISRQVRSNLGVRLVEYRSRIRLMNFIHHADAGRPLTRAALESGFGSYAQCHRVFQRDLGCSPRAYFAGERKRVDDALCSD